MPTPTSLVKLPYSIAVGAQVAFTFDVNKNTSESGVSSRKAMRTVLRNYMLTINPADSDEMMKIVMATYGARYPFALRDYANNYRLTDELLPHQGTVALLGRSWTPATGPLSAFERILLIDETERPFVVSVNDFPTAYSLGDFGRLSIVGLTDLDNVTVTGDYLVAVCIVDTPTTSVLVNSNGVTLHKFSDIRMEQIFEAELVRLTAS